MINHIISLMKSKKLWKDSATSGLIFIGLISSMMTIAGFSLDNIFCNLSWISRLCMIVAIYIVLTVATAMIKIIMLKDGITLKIRGITVNIQQGNIFQANGWKLIPFNEYFDTNVDDIVIAKNTLNGHFIDNYIDNIEEFKTVISDDNRSPLKGNFVKTKGKFQYPLGCIKIYRDYMLLAFTHFNEQNEAHIDQNEYENCLRLMWKEICRTYANKQIFLPLLGSGITRFDGIQYKLKSNLLKCMLCTLRRCDDNINQQITILLTSDAIDEINLYEIKGENDHGI